MRSRLGILLITSALIIGGLGAAAWWLGSTRQTVLTDNGTIEQPAGLVSPRDILWLPPEELDTELIPASGSGGSYHPTGGRFAFAAPGPNGDRDLFEAVESAEGWSVRRLALSSSPDQDTTPSYSADGNWLWFASDRAGGEGGFDLWRSPSTGDGWGVAEHVVLGGVAQSSADELSPALSADGTLLAFARRPDHANPSEIVILDFEGGATPTRVAHGLNSEQDDRAPAFSPAGDFLYFASDREGGAGGLDLFRTRMVDRRPTEAQWLGEEVNSAGDETDPALSMAGFRMRFRTSGEPEAGYRETTAREVYKTVRSRWPSLGIAEELLKLLPWLLLALALALLFAGLRHSASGESWQRRWGTLGLMARCVLASIFLHGLLAILLSLWQVETALPGLDDGDETRVTLTSHAEVASAAAQVRAAAVGAHPAPQEPTEMVTPVESQAPSERALQAEASASGPTVSRPTDSAAAAPQPTNVQPAETSPTLETPSLPAATQARESESSSRDAAVRSARSTPDAASAAEASETRLQPTEVAPDRPTTTRVSEATASAEQLSPAESSTSALAIESSLPDLPTNARIAASETNSRSETGRPATDTIAPASVEGPSATVELGAASTQSSPTSSQQISDASAEPVQAETNLSEISVALDTPSLPALPTGTPSQAESEERSESATVTTSVAPTTSATSPVETFDSSPSLTEFTPTALPLASVSDLSATALPETSLPTLEAPSASLPLPESSRAPARAEVSAAPAESTIPEHQAGDPRSVATIDLPVDRNTTEALAEEVLEAEAALALETPDVPLSQPQGLTPTLPIARVIAGIVVNDLTGEPIPEADVRLDGEGDLIRRAIAGEDGRFTLTPSRLPDFAALTAVADGFIPTAVNVAEEDVGDGTWVELRLQPESRYDIALDPEPRVHHLGNDEFSGRINSQFQMSSEGTRYRATIVLDAEQLEPPTSIAELHIFVRGAQNANPISVNGRVLETTLTDSPDDGSFGEFVARIPFRLLREGENTFQIRATARQGTDIDDFEFVNPRLVLKQRVRRGGSRL